ncbi:MAG: hypothetical protein ACK5L5_10445 [Bacteroidales bacterium]
MKISIAILLMFIVASYNSCDRPEYAEKEGVVARVSNKILTDSDIDYYVIRFISEDSIAYSARKEQFVKQWIQDQLLFDRAMASEVIPKDKLRRMTDDYIRKVVLSSYKNKLFIQDSMATNILDEEISNFYNQNINEFRLDNYLTKGAYISYPEGKISQMQPILRKLSAGGEQNYKEALDRCLNITDFNVDVKVSLFMSADKVAVYFPKFATVNSLKGYSKIENNENGVHSVLYIKEAWNKGEIAPLEYHEENIKELLKYKKKRKHIDDLERRTYVNAIKNKKAEIYDN